MPQPVSIMELLLTFDNINVRKLDWEWLSPDAVPIPLPKTIPIILT